MDKKLFFAILIAVALIGASWYAVSRPTDDGQGSEDDVTIVDGIQVVNLTAKGGYFPRRVVAAAGIPTEILVTTDSTFDCSSALVIPSLSYRKNLLPTGKERIAISPEKATGTLRGTCSMGMYGFEIVFR